ncbi:MAG: DUF4167 domain-containing protein [Proteobacteria bacterium]|nr:DUF4167 domain-containing protein [Pseudomonadota bacterium]
MQKLNQTRRRSSNNSRKSNSSNNTFDSQGPEGKIRGTAHQIFEKYMALARDANSSGDRIAAESFYQFADHYFRLMTSDNESDGNIWRDEGHRPNKSHTFQQNSFAADIENVPQTISSSGERPENPSPKSTRNRENRFENRRSRHPYLGGNSRSYADRQARSESTPQSALQESLPLEAQSETPIETQQDVITVIQ